MKAKTLLVFAAAFLAFSVAAFADWDETQLAKWVQLPNLDSTGIDINASEDYILADDFMCRETGFITSIHIWGSWFSDYLPEGDALNVAFTLSIHADIPASDSPTGYSMPGDVLWQRQFGPGDFMVRVWDGDVSEGWMSPPEDYTFPGDHVCWQYNFSIPAADQFEQLGSPDQPIVYWLDVKAMPVVSDAYFGWKTSRGHWNDDAVWGDGLEPYIGPWEELIYPQSHEMEGRSIDLAFVIVGDEAQPGYKWMQAPDVSILGVDVDATAPSILADDFLCREAGRITDIAVWGSWLDDHIPYWEDPAAVSFTLSIHEDIPDTESLTGYSMPGDVLWYRDFLPGEFTVEVWRDSIREGWMYPPDDYRFPADSTCWLYTFHVDPHEAFFQQGSEPDPIVYWLDVQAHPEDPGTFFGWKTSLSFWNDDAVWGSGPEPYFGPWGELRFPPGHMLAGLSIDLAFRLGADVASGMPDESIIQEDLGLYQNVPNPFNSTTRVRYALPAAAHVEIDVFDVRGRLVGTLMDGLQQEGTHAVEWSGRDEAGGQLPAGIYFCRMTVGSHEISRKMLLLK